MMAESSVKNNVLPETSVNEVPAETIIHNDVPSETSVQNDVPSEMSIHNDVPSETNIHNDIPSETHIHVDFLQTEVVTDSFNTHNHLVTANTFTDNNGLQIAKDEQKASMEISNLSNTDVIEYDISLVKTNIDDDGFQTAKDPLNSINNLVSIEISHLSNTDVSNAPTLQHEQESFSTEVNDSSVKMNSSFPHNYEDYKIGDVIWAKLGKYPYWPSVICADPISKIYIKETKKGPPLLHVRFCNDKGRRSWTKNIEKYHGKFEFQSKYPNCLSSIKKNQNLMNSWNLAVEEANYLLTLDGEERLVSFYKTFSSSDSLTPSTLNNSSESAITMKVRTYSRKRSLTIPEQDSKIIKTECMSNGSTSSKSRSIDIPLLSRSDDADSTVSDISTRYVYNTENTNFKMKPETIKKRRSTKTYPPKSSYIDKYDLYDSMGTSPDYTDDNSLLSDKLYELFNQANIDATDRRMIDKRKLDIREVEIETFNQDNITFPHSRRSSKKNVDSRRTKSDKEICLNNDQNTNLSSNLQSSKKTVHKKKPYSKESSIRRKSTTVKNESSPEPMDTTESEASSKSSKCDTICLTNTKHKQLFTKTLKRACVVCKTIEDTVKCMGPCQSYFHKECLANSEERYKSKPITKTNKTPGRFKKRNSKFKHKNGHNITNNDSQINTDELNEKDAESKSLNDIKSSMEQSSSYTNGKDELPDQSISNDLSINNSYINIDDENTQQLSELETANGVLIQETSKEKIIETSIKPLTINNENISNDDLKYMCSLCKANKTNCFECGLDIEDSTQKIACKLYYCGKYYHEKCLEKWPQCQWIQGSRNNARSIVCPHHVCHLCISDNPKSSCKTHFPAEKLIRCIKCPTTYHRSEYCLPAGCEVLTYFDIICSRHFEPKTPNFHYNATWCFICTLGGTLVCCDLCPSSFHIKCLNQDPSEFEVGFTCEECQTGRYPLYGEIVWVKIGTYRWWPGQIIFPNQVPDTLNAIAHSVGQFPVRFFGTHDYYWVNRGRVFNFHEGDDENILKTNKMKIIDQVFQDAVVEAAQAHNSYMIEKEKNDAIKAKQSLTKPPKFMRIKFNRPIGNVKNRELDNTAMTPCECDPTKSDPCGPGSDCINRMLMFECQPQLCPAGDKCNNQRFEKTLYPAMVPFLTKGRGWGLKTLENIKQGSFVIEYVGDVIDEEEFERRCMEMHKRNEQNYYFLTIDNFRMIDAGPRGNLSRVRFHGCILFADDVVLVEESPVKVNYSRLEEWNETHNTEFMNHSCEPNCVTQKWTVNGHTRIGLFALHDIEADTELVFDYRLQSCSGVEKKPCQCGAARCSKFIGVKVEEEKKKTIPTNDVEKCKASTKNKRKPLKLKDNVSDSDKSKSTKITNNDKNISTTENKIDTSTIEKMNDSKKSKTRTSISKSLLSALKNENSESSGTEKVPQKKKMKKSTRNSSNMTKDDITISSSGSEETVESKRNLKNNLTILLSRKRSIKDDLSSIDDSVIVKKKRQCEPSKKKSLIKTSVISPPEIPTISATTSTLCLFKQNDHITGKENIKDMKTPKNSAKNLMKSEQINEILDNANVIKINESTKTQERSRHSLTRLAKTRHSFLSKNIAVKNTNEQPIEPKRKFNKEKKNVVKTAKAIKKNVEIPFVNTVVVKKNKMNKHSLLSKNYYKNDSCLICGKGHTELSCKNKKCPRVFHLSCMNKSRIVKSGFICPSHFCSVCNKRKVVAKCKLCVDSFCTTHVKGNIFKDPLGNGMLCNNHLYGKKSIPIASTSVTSDLNVTSKVNVDNKSAEPVDFSGSSLSIVMPEVLPDINEDQLNMDTDEINEDDYTLNRVITDECNREYIHIGGFNVCNMPDLVTDQGENYIPPVDTDGDLFRPSSANVVIDIESASALYQSTDSLQLVSIADNKDNDDYGIVHFIPDTNQTKIKWLTAEP